MTKDEFEQWRAGPITEEVMRLLRLRADELENAASVNLFRLTNADDFEPVRRNAIFVRGQVDALDFLIRMTAADLRDEGK